jgi:hypothetical protein
LVIKGALVGEMPLVTLPNLEDGRERTLRVRWDPLSQRLSAALDAEHPQLVYEADIVNLHLGGETTVFYGFTASTGAESNKHTVAP